MGWGSFFNTSTYEMPESPEAEIAPDTAEDVGQHELTGGVTDDTRRSLFSAALGGAFLLGVWAFVDFWRTEGCVREGIVRVVCDDGRSSFALAPIYVMALVGVVLFVYGIASLVDGMRRKSAQPPPPPPPTNL